RYACAEPALRRPGPDGAAADVERALDDVDDTYERLLGAAGIERLGREARQRGDLDRAGPRLDRLRSRAGEELRGDDRGREKRDEDEPIERLADRELVVRRLKQVVDEDEGDDGQRESERAAGAGAGPKHDEQIQKNDVRLIDMPANGEHADRRRGNDDDPEEPGDRRPRVVERHRVDLGKPTKHAPSDRGPIATRRNRA